MNDKDIFLKRMFLYNLQGWVGGILSVAIWYKTVALFKHLGNKTCEDISFSIFCSAPFIIFALYNTITYFYSGHLAKKYGIEMFSDLDQEWLIEHQAFDCKAFGEYFSRTLKCRKIAGIYMLAVITPAVLINIYLGLCAGILYFIGYVVYCNTYFDIAISYKVPRAFGGGGIVVSKIIDQDLNNKLDKLDQKLEEKTFQI